MVLPTCCCDVANVLLWWCLQAGGEEILRRARAKGKDKVGSGGAVGARRGCSGCEVGARRGRESGGDGVSASGAVVWNV